MAKVLGLITARGGSKRIPGKNIKEFLNKPLIYYTIETAKESGVLDRIVLTTDDEEIAEIGRQYGAEAPFIRPKELAQDNTGSLPVIQHAVKWLKDNENYCPDWIILLEPSSPGRQVFHIRELVQMLDQGRDIDSIVGVSEIPSHFSPVKALKMDEKGNIARYPDKEMIKNLVHRNQDIPKLYFINSAVYAFKTANLFSTEPSLWGSKVLGYKMDLKYSLDIDTPDDWKIAETKMKELFAEENNFSQEVQIGRFKIGKGHPVRIIAEIADSHNGSIETAKKMILEAKKAGADIVKFQLHLPDQEMIPGSIKMWDGSLYDILKQNLLTIEDHRQLKQFCEQNDIMYLCTPFCSKAADLLDEIGVEAFKIGSGEMTNLPMIEHIARKGKTMIVSTGMANWQEIRPTVELIKKHGAPLILNNCTSAYPPKYEDINLGLIEKLAREFNVPIGHSDHSPDIYTGFAAAACGAKLIEKHFTLDKTQQGPDHFISLEPAELKELVNGIRKIEKSLGKEKKVQRDEEAVRGWALHSVVSARDIPAQTIICQQDLIVKRPGTGIPAKDIKKVIGRKTKNLIKKDFLIKLQDLY